MTYCPDPPGEYDRGGWLIPGTTLLVGKGQPERVLTRRQRDRLANQPELPLDWGDSGQDGPPER